MTAMLNPVVTKLKPLCYRIMASRYCPPLWLWKANASENVAVAMMHGIHDRAMAARVKAPASSILVDDFRAMLLLLKGTCHIISLDDAVDMLEGRRAWRPDCIVLTFDDSLKCLATLAAPLLSELGFTATFYISTDVINMQRPYWWRRLEQAVQHTAVTQKEIKLPAGTRISFHARLPNDFLSPVKNMLKSASSDDLEATVRSIEIQLGADNLQLHPFADPFGDVLTWDDVRHLCDLGMTIGSHTVLHRNLGLLNAEDLRFELEESRRILEERCRVPVRHLAYPFGCYSSAVREVARSCGYLSGVTTRTPGSNPEGMDLFQLRRFSMPHEPYKLPYVLRSLATV